MPETDSGLDRRSVLRGIGAAGLAGIGATGTVGAQEALTITGVWTGGEEEDFLAVVDYVSEETGLDIVYQPRTTEAILTGTLIDYEGGVAPADIVVMPSPARVQSDAAAGHLAELGDAWDPENFAPDPEQVTADGTVYAAPFKMDLKPGFWYRPSFFEEHGLEEPEGYDEFLDLVGEIDGIEGVDAPLASGNGDGWPLSDVTEAFVLRQDDGAALQRDLIAGEASMTDDRVATAFEEIQSLLQEGYFSEVRDFGVQYEYFWANQTPLYFMGSWTPGFEAIQDPEDLDVFMVPGAESMVAAENWFTVPSYSSNVEEATTAVETFVSAEGQQVWAERGGFIASNTEVSDDAYELEIMQELAAMSGEVELVPDLDDTLGDPFQSSFWAQLTGLWADPGQDVGSVLETLDDSLSETTGDGSGG